ncbi:sulfotransferase 1B1-like isoform X2 [Argopecten irradians]|uniref:sulfotransferase 1B1-like isoform X2 n=1 Tax=Argopecten irradians TaxID=31199 RepID=UPI003717482D
MEHEKAESTDEKGIISKYYDGIHFPTLVPGDVKDHLNAVKNLKHRECDILLGAFPKSGTHWAFDVLYMLQTGKAEYSFDKIIALDFEPTEKFDALDSPRVLVTHFYPQHIPKYMVDEKCKIVYIYRNPKDTAVSAHLFLQRFDMVGFLGYDGEWEQYLELFTKKHVYYNSWFDHVKSWMEFKKTNPHLPILFMSYEDMKRDLRSCVQVIAEHLGSKQDPEFLDQVADKCQFSPMSKAKTADKTETAMSKDGSNPFYRKENLTVVKTACEYEDNHTFTLGRRVKL